MIQNIYKGKENNKSIELSGSAHFASQRNASGSNSAMYFKLALDLTLKKSRISHIAKNNAKRKQILVSKIVLNLKINEIQ